MWCLNFLFVIGIIEHMGITQCMAYLLMEVWAIAKVYHIIGFHHTHANKVVQGRWNPTGGVKVCSYLSRRANENPQTHLLSSSNSDRTKYDCEWILNCRVIGEFLTPGH